MRTSRLVPSVVVAVLGAVANACAGPPASFEPPADAGTRTDAAPGARRPRVILMIGDGMGPGQLEAASLYAHGAPGRLFMQSLPVRGTLDSGNLSGTVDSAAAATTMATGVRTWNGRIGVDRDEQPVPTLVEDAHARGLAAGLVTTASLPHATPGGFSAHRRSRHSYLEIADDQALLVRPEVMLGGGAQYYLPAGAGSLRPEGHAGLLAPLAAEGWQVVRSAAELADASAAAATKGRVVGVFAPDHLAYTLDRPADTVEPTLTEMSLAALTLLDTDPDGFFLMIEGARIDMASHGNMLERAIGETLAFDDAVRAVAAWAAAEGDITLLVTADHECGGLTVVTPQAAGTYPTVTWRWGAHTNALVPVFGAGAGTGVFDGQRLDHTWIHAVLRAELLGTPLSPPPRELVPDGDLGELRWLAATQTTRSAFGAGYNQLDALWLDADERALALGVSGLFEWQRNAVVVLIDVDFGASTGPARLADALLDLDGRADAIVSSLSLDAPGIAGFGADFALVAWGGADPHLEDLLGEAGLRGLRDPFGAPANLHWYGAAMNFGDGVRTRTTLAPSAPPEDLGWEVHVPWATLFPTLAGAVPAGATVAVAVVLVNDDGGYTSNQALPSFPASMTANPGRADTPLPGLVTFVVDANLDGVADGDLAPEISLAP